MRISQRARALCPTHRTALAAALALALGTTSAAAAQLNVPSPTYPTLGSAIAHENTLADCSADTIVMAQGFVVSESSPLVVTCSGLSITGSGSGALIDENNFFYGGGSCGIDSTSAPISVDNLEIRNFVYGAGLCGQFNSVTRNRIHGNGWGMDVYASPGRASIGNGSGGGNAIYGNNTLLNYGLLVDSDASADIIGNVFGMNGSSFAPNGTGINISGSTDVTVDNNLVVESSTGIDMMGSGEITNNRIGVDFSGAAVPGAGGLGIVLNSGSSGAYVHGNTVGGMTNGIQAAFMTAGEISNNTVGTAGANGPSVWGIGILCSSGMQVTGNSVSGQSSTGVLLAEASAVTLSGNSISGNVRDGVQVTSTNCALRGSASDDSKRAGRLSVMARVLTASSGNTLQSNTISNNGGAGVAILPNSASSNNLFESNTITGNRASGISIQDSSSIDNAIISNVIAGNTPKNIDLVPGANEDIPSPQIQSVVQSGGNTTVTYQVLGPAGGAPYTIEFFTNPDASAPAGSTFQRQVFLPNVAGTQTFSEVFTGALDFFSLTSTLSTPTGGWIETSEFSPVGTAVVVAPAITFSPVSTDFGDIYVHHDSDARTVTVTNSSSSAVTIGAPSLTGPFIITSHDCPALLPPGVSCSVNIVFAPASSGRASGTLTFASFSASLSGTGLDAPILDTPALLDFGTFIAGSPAVTQAASITNTGSAAVTIDSITVSGPFTLTHDCPINLLPGASCTLTIGFSSSELGAAAGMVTIHSNALGGDHVISLGALVQLKPEPVIEINPSSLNFGHQFVGTQSPSARVVIVNTGGAAANLGPFTTGTHDYVVVGTTCTTTLAPQTTCTVDVALDPTGFGGRHDALSFTGNAAGSPFSVGLDGSGCRPPALIANRTGKPIDPCSQ